MSLEISIELHSKACSCRGGCWAAIGGQSAARCSDGGAAETMTLSMAEWKSHGKPATLEEYRQARDREAKGERREFQRYHAVLAVRLSRTGDFRSAVRESEDTFTEIIAAGGALVRTRIAVEPKDTLLFEHPPHYRSRAEVGYVSPAVEGGQRYLRVGLRFLDAPFPEKLIPPGSQPA